MTIAPRCFLSWRSVPVRGTHHRAARSLAFWSSWWTKWQKILRPPWRRKRIARPTIRDSLRRRRKLPLWQQRSRQNWPGRVTSQSRWRASEIVELVAGEVVCNARTGVRRQQIVNVLVPQILKQSVEVIKVILQEHCQWMRLFTLERQLLTGVFGGLGWVVVCLQKYRRQHGWTAKRACERTETSVRHGWKLHFGLQCSRLKVATSQGTVLHSSCGSTNDSLASTARRGWRLSCSHAAQCGSPAGDASVASPEEETRGEANYGRAIHTGLVRLGGRARGTAAPLAWMGQQDDRGPLGGMAAACLPTLALDADTATMAGWQQEGQAVNRDMLAMCSFPFCERSAAVLMQPLRQRPRNVAWRGDSAHDGSAVSNLRSRRSWPRQAPAWLESAMQRGVQDLPEHEKISYSTSRSSSSWSRPCNALPSPSAGARWCWTCASAPRSVSWVLHACAAVEKHERHNESLAPRAPQRHTLRWDEDGTQRASCAYGKDPPKPWIVFSGTVQDRRCACIVPMMRWSARVRPFSSRNDLGGSSNFQTRAPKTIHVARLSPFARTRALLSWCSALGWQMGLSLRGVLGWQMGLSLRPWSWECFEREHTCLGPERWWTMLGKDTFSWWLAAIPTCAQQLVPSEVSLTIAGVEQFFRCSECLEELAINVLFWTILKVKNGQDPVLILLNPWCKWQLHKWRWIV